jgi:N6-L-threonylcarbamoyladenine synthase
VISSQLEHARFGGVVPEIASRHHIELINAVVEEALTEAGTGLDEIKLIAATQGPGLVGALLVGFMTAKSIATARELPFAPVDHLQGHIAANFLQTPLSFEPPFICLLASGGHTLMASVEDHAQYALLGQTLDDAAGEAFDKSARLLGLPYPGGAHLSKLAESGDPTAFSFPVAARVKGMDFSFAGLKTALLYKVRDLGESETAERSADLAASFEQAIVEALMMRIEHALEESGFDRLAIGGGVAANRKLRERVAGLGITVNIPPSQLCTDNAAMIASAARYVPPLQYPAFLGLDVYARVPSRQQSVPA